MEESAFAQFVQEIFQYFVDSFGVLGLPAAILVLIVIMIIQAIIAPIVSEVILASAGGILYKAFGDAGIYAAVLGGVIGSILGAIASFYIARWLQGLAKQRIVDKYNDEDDDDEKILGRWDRFMNWLAHLLSRFIDEDSEDFIDIIEKRGFLIVLIGRMLVIIPFDAVSYASGFTRIRFNDYIIATTIGTIPRVIFYVLVGTQLATALTTNFSLFVFLFVVVAGGIFGLYKLAMKYIRDKSNTAGNEKETSEDLDVREISLVDE